MILAAGLGTRIRSLDSDLPKPLIPIGGRALIEYPLALLRKYGITEVVINLHYKKERILNALGDGSRFSMKFHYSDEEKIMGTGGGIKKVEDVLAGGPFLVINSDVVAEVDLLDVIGFHKRNKPAATLVLRDDPDAEKWGPVEINPGGRILRILGRPETGAKGGAQKMFTGIHILEPRVLDFIPAGKPYHIIDAYIEMIRSGETLMGYSFSGYWMDVGTPGRVKETQSDLASGKIRLAGGKGSGD